jgi:hypothetical protein
MEKNIVLELFCSKCFWKRYIREKKDLEDLIEYKQSELQKSIKNNTNLKLNKKFKCKNCGFVVSLKKIQDTQKVLLDQKELEKRVAEIEEFNIYINNFDKKDSNEDRT